MTKKKKDKSNESLAEALKNNRFKVINVDAREAAYKGFRRGILVGLLIALNINVYLVVAAYIIDVL